MPQPMMLPMLLGVPDVTTLPLMEPTNALNAKEDLYRCPDWEATYERTNGDVPRMKDELREKRTSSSKPMDILKQVSKNNMQCALSNILLLLSFFMFTYHFSFILGNKISWRNTYLEVY